MCSASLPAFVVACAVLACASAPSAPPAAATAASAGPAPAYAASPACEAFAKPGVLRRSAVVRVVDGGLGRWLAGVELDPGLDQGRFRGWIVRRLYGQDPCYRLVDVRAGDLVLRVNRRSLERPEAANQVFTGLRTAPAIVVDLVRGGREMEVRFAIAND